MANYEKPVIIDTEEHYEGVYAASGDNTDSGVSAPKCDSKYMNGCLLYTSDAADD